MDECPICLELLLETEKNITVECCKKQFHTECYLNCMKLKQECPMCRRKINQPTEHTALTIGDSDQEYYLQFKRRFIFSALLAFSFTLFIYFGFRSRR